MNLEIINKTLRKLEYGKAMFKIMTENLEENDDTRLKLAFRSSIESFELAIEAYNILKCVFEIKEEKTL
jgi:hypothetical protein